MAATPNAPFLYQMLKWLAVATAVFVIGATTYNYIIGGAEDQSDLHYRRGNLRLEDGQYKEALKDFNALLQEDSSSAEGHLGKALALKGLGKMEAALQTIDLAIEYRPDFAAAYANRGIILDYLGRYPEAIKSYRHALKLDPSMGEGPDWITRFLRNQADAPPGIADRAGYLEQELKKPESERVLRIPEKDREQRSYKVEGNLEPSQN